MVVRAYLAPIVGTGTEGDPYRSLVEDLGFPHTASIPHHHAPGRAHHGSPVHRWALTLAPDVPELRDHADMVSFPADFSQRWDGAKGAKLLAAIKVRFGVTYAADIGDTVIDIVTALGRALDGSHYHVHQHMGPR